MWECPAISDPGWRSKTLPLLQFLSVRRTWKELNQFARTARLSGSLLRQQLAFLEDRKFARAVLGDNDQEWAWISTVSAVETRVTDLSTSSCLVPITVTTDEWPAMTMT